MADATTSTNVCDTFKTDVMLAAHNFSAQVNVGAATGTTSTHLTAVGTIAGVGVGMGVCGTNIAANTVVAALVSQTAFDLSIATSGAPSAVLVNGDIFKILLINGLAGNSGIAYGQSTSNVGTPATGTPSNTNVGTDEVAASGQYSAGGQILAANTTPALSTHTAWTSWTVNPTWGPTSTLSVIGAIIYNTGTTLTGAGAGTATAQPRLGSVNGITANLSGSAVNHAVAVYDFGGRQTVTSGTLTLTFPATGATAILRIA
jgi:hypothetical protein